MKKNAILGVLAGALLLLTAGGAALAANQIECPNRDGGRCIGTANADEMIGSQAEDTIRGRGGPDLIKGRRGGDELHGETGGDTIVAARCAAPGTDIFGGRGDDDIIVTSDCGDLTIVPPADRVDCGPGRNDVVRGVLPDDRIDESCERVVPQRSS